MSQRYKFLNSKEELRIYTRAETMWSSKYFYQVLHRWRQFLSTLKSENATHSSWMRVSHSLTLCFHFSTRFLTIALYHQICIHYSINFQHLYSAILVINKAVSQKVFYFSAFISTRAHYIISLNMRIINKHCQKLSSILAIMKNVQLL